MADASPMTEDTVEQHLSPGERIEAVGRPDPTKHFTRGDVFLIFIDAEAPRERRRDRAKHGKGRGCSFDDELEAGHGWPPRLGHTFSTSAHVIRYAPQ
jgi:hypothetical protein